MFGDTLFIKKVIPIYKLKLSDKFYHYRTFTRHNITILGSKTLTQSAGHGHLETYKYVYIFEVSGRVNISDH